MHWHHCSECAVTPILGLMHTPTIIKSLKDAKNVPGVSRCRPVDRYAIVPQEPAKRPPDQQKRRPKYFDAGKEQQGTVRRQA